VGRVTDLERHAQLLEVGIDPVALMEERGLALGERADLIVVFSQSQTPTAPRSAVGFFRFGCPVRCLSGLITQSTSGLQILLR
jgi:hypothetical protein